MEVVWWDDKRMLRKVKVPLPLCDRSLLHALQSLESCFAQLARRSLQANDVTCSFHSQQVLSKIRNSCSTHLPPSPRPPHPPMAGTKSQAIFPGLLRSPVTKGGNLTANATSVNACRSSSVNGKQIRLQTDESHMSLACPKKLKPPAKGNLEPWISLRLLLSAGRLTPSCCERPRLLATFTAFLTKAGACFSDLFTYKNRWPWHISRISKTKAS